MSNVGRIVLITNRNVTTTRTTSDISLFGDDLNTIHNADLNIATVTRRADKSWRLKLLSNAANPDYDKPASKVLFDQIADDTANGENGDWVFFIHGFNQSLNKNLKKCYEIASYGVNVVAFSWPSNPGPSGLHRKLKEYRRAQHNARESISALYRTMEKIHSQLNENSASVHFNLNLVIHSLGNYLFQEYVKTTDKLEYLKIFNNVLLHEADVDNKGHKQWVDKVSDYAKVYITINEHDKTLNGSDIINKGRLGNTARKLNASEAVYIDLTNGLGVRLSHRPWNKPAKRNPVIKDFYRAVFTGGCGEKAGGWVYKAKKNAYCLKIKEPLILDSDYSE